MTESFSENGLRAGLALLADCVPEPEAGDLIAAQRAWAAGRRAPRRTGLARLARERPALVWPVVAACAVAFVLVVASVVSSMVPLARSAPSPAEPILGPGALPEHVYVAPAWTPSVADRPLARAAYVVKVQDRSGLGLRGMVVSADDGAYRQVPAAAADGVLSWDGRRLAWAEKPGLTRTSLAVVHVLDLPTGKARQVRLRLDGAVDTLVDGLAFDHVGERLALWGSTSRDGTSGTSVLGVVDVGALGTDEPLRLVSSCASTCFGPVAWLADGRLAYPEAGPTIDGLRGVTGVAVPADPRQSWGTNLVGAGHRLALDAVGRTRYFAATTGSGGEAPAGRPYSRMGTGQS